MQIHEAPEPTVGRLVVYLRCLRRAQREGVGTLSSAQIQAQTGISANQIRKDLSYFGEFGKPGTGYKVGPLLAHLSQIMQLDRERRIIIVGAGNLGTALAGYGGFRESGFKLVAIFDNNFSKIGGRLWEHEIVDVRRMREVVAEEEAEIGLIATPVAGAQVVADLMVEAGIKAILNFAPTRVVVEKPVAVRQVDLTHQLELLCFHLPRG